MFEIGDKVIIVVSQYTDIINQLATIIEVVKCDTPTYKVKLDLNPAYRLILSEFRLEKREDV